ncbi:hypothetical protein BOTBODRAFT_67540 [Botryobasidium botryosum FD-172 SS1]|uniref:SGNH hydrolase-type esterase domain-containing protein n=1 Tax=Botryobasidium botryosum (strain FD-172 SS1) TaxID=930990 RepID=A0A067M9Y8_BOTB1|nr:hypothetical protein BOTBODRAFT_67540 [Botryobasidium botryosum FD-172 SS1]
MAANFQDAMMLLGDSITEFSWTEGGLAQKLAAAYSRRCDVVNRGFSGYNTEWILPIFSKAFAKKPSQHWYPRVNLLTVWFGANDACIPSSHQYVPLEKFKQNLLSIISMVRQPTSEWYSPSTRVILITPPPVNEKLWLDRRLVRSREYADAVKQVAQEAGVGVVDAWTAIWESAGETEENLRDYLYDGLHLNAEGYRIVYDRLIETISMQHPELHYDSLPYVHPKWDELQLAVPENPGQL